MSCLMAQLFLLLFIFMGRVTYLSGVKFSAESFAEISLFAEKGKSHLESLREKANVPQFGSCWKNAITNLQIGCKFLSENVQSDLALSFTDCFLQMSGHEPLNCDFPRSACLKKLTDRAFNAYTEFYTHTQSICYFLQSQVWHEETEKTINKLSSTSLEVSKKLEESQEAQQQLLHQQKESLVMQREINNSSKNVAQVLQLSQSKLHGFMEDFKNAAAEQKELLVEVFENLVLFRSWAVNELSWFNSTIYFATVTLISFLFTSVSRTREARMVIFIVFAMNYFFERILSSPSVNGLLFGSYDPNTQELLNSWIWLCRKFCICLSVVLLLYTALTFCDYNLQNYKLLLEIKKQNIKILGHFESMTSNENIMKGNKLNELNSTFSQFNDSRRSWNNQTAVFTIQENTPSRNFSTNLHLNHFPVNKFNFSSRDSVDAEENIMLDNEENKSESNVSITDKTKKQPRESNNYNLRSNKKKTSNV